MHVVRGSGLALLMLLLAAVPAVMQSAAPHLPPRPVPTEAPALAPPSSEPQATAEPLASIDLAVALPVSVAGNPLEVKIFTADQVAANIAASPELTEFLNHHGRTAADVQMGGAYGFDAQGVLIAVVAMRIVGVDANPLVPILFALAKDPTATPPPTRHSVVFGKPALGWGRHGTGQFLVVRGDAVYMVSSNLDDYALEVIRLLP